ncbi:hypothetical protein [Nocardioides sp. LHG3406-4]|uniref:hypothetical protein n=1 Tax=Nocardioides sp. LHG3406-4 TaxID=2804575 RepID=UPI003CF383E6
MTHSGSRSGDEPPEVGSLAEEAAKLMGALSGWAREHGDLGANVGDLASRASDAVRDVEAHLATGAAECTWCPVCRTVHAVRSMSPEVRGHLTSAATSLMHAVVGALATAVPDDGREGRSADVEHIDVDEGDWEDDV